MPTQYQYLKRSNDRKVNSFSNVVGNDLQQTEYQ